MIKNLVTKRGDSINLLISSGMEKFAEDFFEDYANIQWLIATLDDFCEKRKGSFAKITFRIVQSVEELKFALCTREYSLDDDVSLRTKGDLLWGIAVCDHVHYDWLTLAVLPMFSKPAETTTSVNEA